MLLLIPMHIIPHRQKQVNLVLGLNGAYNFSGDGEKQLIGGLYYRLGDAIMPMAGFELSNVRFTFSYDATTSSLKDFNNYRGALEFSVIKKGFYGDGKGNRQTLCPTF